MFSRDNITLGLAILGSVLGIINFWRQVRKDRVRIRVTPKVAYPVGEVADQRPRLCIDVVNLSAFPITVSDTGFTLWFSRERLALVRPIIIDGKPWPRRLESREAFTVYFNPTIATDPKLARVRRAYAKTDCGHIQYGKSKGLHAYTHQTLQEP